MKRIDWQSSLVFGSAFLIIAVLLGLIIQLQGQYFLALSFICLVVSMLPFYWRFEKRQIRAREIVMIAVLATIAAVSRVPFAPLPSVQPTSRGDCRSFGFGSGSWLHDWFNGGLGFEFLLRSRAVDTVADVLLGDDGRDSRAD